MNWGVLNFLISVKIKYRDDNLPYSMEDADSFHLNDETSDNASSDHVVVSRKENGSTRRSVINPMNEDDIDNENSRSFISNLPMKESSTKKIESTQIYDFDSDEDTFADADSDCEPDHFYLQEMLEDEHPERLSLFDYRKKEQEKENSSRTLSSSDTHNDENVVEDSSTSGHEESGTERLIRNLNIDSDSESANEGPGGMYDSVSNLPTIKKRGSGGRLSMGTSPSVGPGRAMLRQASRKTVWGK